MKFLIFAASHREGSYNRKLAVLAADHMAAKGATVDLAEYRAFDMPMYDDSVATVSGVPDIAQSFAKRAADADGILIASPEYNWSLPGSLKNIIDWTSRLNPNPLAGKTAMLLNATTASRGGITGLSHLKTALEAQQMFVFYRMYTLGRANELLQEHRLLDRKQEELFLSQLDAYFMFTRKLASQ